MALPKIFYGLPFLALGALLPSVLAAPAPAPPGAIGMRHEKFDQQTVRIHRGETLRFVNNSGWLHVIGPGEDGRFASEAGAPDYCGGKGMETTLRPRRAGHDAERESGARRVPVPGGADH